MAARKKRRKKHAKKRKTTKRRAKRRTKRGAKKCGMCSKLAGKHGKKKTFVVYEVK